MSLPPAPASAPEPPARIFGVCAAIGQDFRINPDWLRIGFAAALLFALEAVLVAYAALGVVVLASRLLFPDQRPAQAADAPATEQEEQPEEWRRAA